MADLVVLDNVNKRYAPHLPPAVDGLSLSLKTGEILALLGPSGSGKTTALRLIAGFETPDAGTVYLNGFPIAGNGFWVSPEDRHVGMVFQDYALFPHLTLLQNVAFGLRGSVSSKEAKALDLLSKVGMKGMGGRYPHELSGGEQQRVALARALAPGPHLILLDEPFSNLDADMRTQMRREVERILRELGTSAILVTHDQEESFSIADQVGVLNRGRLEQLGSPYTLYHTPSTRFVADFVGEADFLPGEVRSEIVTEVGAFPNRSGLAPGTNVEVMFRPDDVDFEPTENGNATVLGKKFRGSESRYLVRLASGLRLHSSQPSDRVVPAGTKVKVIARPKHLVVFPI